MKTVCSLSRQSFLSGIVPYRRASFIASYALRSNEQSNSLLNEQRRRVEEERAQWRRRARGRRVLAFFALVSLPFAGIWTWNRVKEYTLKETSAGDVEAAAGSDEAIQIQLLKRLPLRAFSAGFGALANVRIPEPFRVPIYSLYSWIYNCRLEDMDRELSDFSSMAEFFSRPLRRGCRPLARDSGPGSLQLSSPVDGCVLHFGSVDSMRRLEQIKGMSFTLAALLGGAGGRPSLSADSSEQAQKRANEDDYDDVITDLYCGTEPLSRRLYFCTIYLSPGDYHGIHSPAPMNISYRRHLPGFMLPVSGVITRSVPSLFTINERVVLFGQWGGDVQETQQQHRGVGAGGAGSDESTTTTSQRERERLMAMVAVAATNVGNIRVACDPQLHTNNNPLPAAQRYDLEFDPPVAVDRGEQVAAFLLGSTVVMVFEGSEDFQFHIKPGQHLLLGEKIGTDKE